MMEITCDACGKNYRVDETKMKGSKARVKCKACDSGSLEILSGRELDIESIEIAEEGHNDSG